MRTGFHCSSPSPFTSWSSLTSSFDVADLDRRVTRDREQVHLVALLDLLGLESGEVIVGVTEGLAEGTPFPAGRSLSLVRKSCEVLERLTCLRLLLAGEVDAVRREEATQLGGDLERLGGPATGRELEHA